MHDHPDGRERCRWCGTDPLYVAYHDAEWGVPEREGRALFEKLILDGFQAGLAWITILRKRDGFRRAFAGFDPAAIARFGEADVARLLADPGIVRSGMKIRGAINSARAYEAMAERGEDFADYLWGFVGGEPIVNRFARGEGLTRSEVSERLAKDLKRRGFSFCGPVIVYAFMQAVGMVNDHATSCFRHRELGGA